MAIYFTLPEADFNLGNSLAVTYLNSDSVIASLTVSFLPIPTHPQWPSYTFSMSLLLSPALAHA